MNSKGDQTALQQQDLRCKFTFLKHSTHSWERRKRILQHMMEFLGPKSCLQLEGSSLTFTQKPSQLLKLNNPNHHKEIWHWSYQEIYFICFLPKYVCTSGLLQLTWRGKDFFLHAPSKFTCYIPCNSSAGRLLGAPLEKDGTSEHQNSASVGNSYGPIFTIATFRFEDLNGEFLFPNYCRKQWGF